MFDILNRQQDRRLKAETLPLPLPLARRNEFDAIGVFCGRQPMKDRLPSMPFFVEDYLGSMSVRLMTLAERGAYIHLLRLNWQDGLLKKDPKKPAK